MTDNEFIEAYSDDQVYLEIFDKMIESQPGGMATPDFIKFSACCRLWAVMMIGSMEMMIKEWGKNDPLWHDINRYVGGGDNVPKVKNLKRSLEMRGFKFGVDTFDDFLAIIYIRNAYVHGRWKPAQQKYVVSRGFEGDVMHFTESDFRKMKKVYGEIMNALGMSKALYSTRSATSATGK